MKEKIGIFWFRQDLRLHDNLALLKLIKKCDKIIPIFILDNNENLGSASKWWLHYSLESLDNSLKLKDSQLFYYEGSPYKILKELVNKYNITNIYWNRLYDKYSIQRDSNIKNKFNLSNIEVVTFKGSLINEPWKIKNKSNSFFKVFTPYWKTCLEESIQIKLLNPPEKIKTLFNKSLQTISKKDFKLFSKKSTWPKKLLSYWTPGEKNALINFNNFKNNIVENYDEGRDRPDKDYTSKLSPYLHFGEISPERIFEEIQKKKTLNIKSKNKFLAEIGWREFSYNLLFYYPNIKSKPIQEKFKKFPWKNNSKYLNAWKKGKTGYPIIDAGMRQLYETGWMHNRVRMIVGSFLCKNLLLHWREGEKWFFDTLVDADLGSNSAGWQWIAGCGADAAPYFRVFNPLTQSLKFDSKGEYVKKYITELKNIPSSQVHAPWKLNLEDQKKFKCIIGKDYPKPIVNLPESRDKALKAFSYIKVSN